MYAIAPASALFGALVVHGSGWRQGGLPVGLEAHTASTRSRVHALGFH